MKRYLQVIHKRQPLYRKLGQATSDDTGWVSLNLERERICTLLLEEVARVRRAPLEGKDWEPHWYQLPSPIWRIHSRCIPQTWHPKVNPIFTSKHATRN